MKSRKLSISLPEHIYRLAMKKAELTHGESNFSGFVRDLLCKEFTEEELRNEITELKKPLWTGGWKKAEFTSICMVCKNPISENDEIYSADLGCPKETDNWVHKKCCRVEKE